jgi:hypothetical protein
MLPCYVRALLEYKDYLEVEEAMKDMEFERTPTPSPD